MGGGSSCLYVCYKTVVIGQSNGYGLSVMGAYASGAFAEFASGILVASFCSVCSQSAVFGGLLVC